MFHIRGMPEASRIASEAFFVREIRCHLPERDQCAGLDCNGPTALTSPRLIITHQLWKALVQDLSPGAILHLYQSTPEVTEPSVTMRLVRPHTHQE